MNAIKINTPIRSTAKSSFFHNNSLKPLQDIRFSIMKNIMEIITFIILTLNTL